MTKEDIFNNIQIVIDKNWTERSVKIHLPEFYEEVRSWDMPDDLKFNERLYWYLHDIKDCPRCICGNRLKFLSIRRGYPLHCSVKCSSCDESTREKVVSTCRKRFGTDAPAQSKQVLEKMQHTCIDRFGVENPLMDKDVRERMKETMIEKYGGLGNSCSQILDKYKKTSLEKFGVENYSQTDEGRALARERCVLNEPENKQKATESHVHKLKISHDDFIGKNENMWICSCPHPECNKCEEKWYETISTIYLDRRRDGTEPCTRLLPIRACTNKGTTLEVFIHNILDKYNIEYICNDRKILNGKEIDIYIPSKKIAIERNGVYCHCSKHKESSYHNWKCTECKKNDIQLLTIWEDWIKNKPEIIESIILSKLGIYKKRIGARQCTLKDVPVGDARAFLDDNHIQGFTSSTTRLGLYYKDELVSLMLFGKKKSLSGNKDECELSRFCNKKDWQVVGGAMRLFTHYIKTYTPTNIVSFSSNDISNGALYRILGFTQGNTNQSYWYIESGTLSRYHRSTFTKASIVDRGWKDANDSSWTEEEVMYEHGYYRIYDSGQIKWVFTVLR